MTNNGDLELDAIIQRLQDAEHDLQEYKRRQAQRAVAALPPEERRKLMRDWTKNLGASGLILVPLAWMRRHKKPLITVAAVTAATGAAVLWAAWPQSASERGAPPAPGGGSATITQPGASRTSGFTPTVTLTVMPTGSVVPTTTFTVPPSTITPAPETVTIPGGTVTLPPSVLTQAPVTSTVTAVATSTSVVTATPPTVTATVTVFKPAAGCRPLPHGGWICKPRKK